MKQTYKHPLDIAADAVKQAFLVNGFRLFDDGEAPELLPLEKTAAPFPVSSRFAADPILLEDGNWLLRTEQLTASLPAMKGPLPIQKISCGVVYSRADEAYPGHLRVEGVLAKEDFSMKDYQTFWNQFAVSLFGIHACGRLRAADKNSFEIIVERPDRTPAVIGCTGPGSWLTRTLLDTDREGVATWGFLVEIDLVAAELFDLHSRAELYSCRLADLQQHTDESAATGDNYLNRLADLARRKGFARFHGMRLYPADIYKKMNMIQEAWDTNNKGVQLVQPLNGNTGLPTVLTPALEQALADCHTAGAKAAKIFDIAHIFLPDAKGGAPLEKISITMGVYGPDVNSKAFKEEIDSFLNEAGVRSHFFFPTNLAIAYDTSDTWLVLDEKMRYLEGNFGGISPKAEANYGIGVHCFMANLEIGPLKEKSEEEYRFTPPELL